jgi:hypothetical protein
MDWSQIFTGKRRGMIELNYFLPADIGLARYSEELVRVNYRQKPQVLKRWLNKIMFRWNFAKCYFDLSFQTPPRRTWTARSWERPILQRSEPSYQLVEFPEIWKQTYVTGYSDGHLQGVRGAGAQLSVSVNIAQNHYCKFKICGQ